MLPAQQTIKLVHGCSQPSSRTRATLRCSPGQYGIFPIAAQLSCHSRSRLFCICAEMRWVLFWTPSVIWHIICSSVAEVSLIDSVSEDAQIFWTVMKMNAVSRMVILLAKEESWMISGVLCQRWLVLLLSLVLRAAHLFAAFTISLKLSLSFCHSGVQPD